MRKRDWCKLDEDWAGNRKVRRVLRKHGPVAGAYWTLLIARAYAASHHEDNPTGIIRCGADDLAEELSDRHDRTEMWDSLVSAKLIRVKGETWLDDDLEIELVDFNGWQHPKGAPARRQLEKREAEKGADLQGCVTAPSRPVTDAFVSVTQIESKSKKKKEKKTSASPAEIAIFNHWVKATGKTAAAKLTTKRLDKIREARKLFTNEQIAMAITFQAANAYRDDKGVVHNDLELFLRDEDRIQKKIEAVNDGGTTTLFDGSPSDPFERNRARNAQINGKAS